MLSYRFDRLQDDGTWTVQEFQSIGDHEAITYGLRTRTANRCELYQGHRWLATFDGATEHNDNQAPQTVEKIKLNSAWTATGVETEVAHVQRQASKEKQRPLNGANAADKLAYLTQADNFESLARALEAEQRRRNFYDVNAPRGETGKILTTVSDRPCGRSDNRKVCYSASLFE